MPNLIKGYIPLRVSFPTSSSSSSTTTTKSSNDANNKNDTRSTFLFAKQHITNANNSNTMESSSSKTLFIANAPFYPSIQTSLLLQTIFEKYANVDKVIVASKPQKDLLSSESRTTSDENDNDVSIQMFENEIKTLGEGTMYGMSLNEYEWFDQGRFAHIIFSSTKEMKKALSAMGGSGSNKKKNKKKGQQGDLVGHVQLKRLELQELQDVSVQLFNKEKRRLEKSRDNEDDENEDEDDSSEESEDLDSNTNAIMKLVQSHQNRIPSRQALKQICDKIMTKYEQEEVQARQKQQQALGTPDDDGFVTVSYTTAVGDKLSMEEKGLLGSAGEGENKVGRRRKREAMRRARSSKKGVVKGNEKLQDFYRFQLKETRKRSMVELKTRFEEDLRKVKKMKEEKMYRPF